MGTRPYGSLHNQNLRCASLSCEKYDLCIEAQYHKARRLSSIILGFEVNLVCVPIEQVTA